MIGIQISLNSWYSCLVGICLCQPGKRWAVAAIFSCDMVYMCDCWKILDWRVYIYICMIYIYRQIWLWHWFTAEWFVILHLAYITLSTGTLQVAGSHIVFWMIWGIVVTEPRRMAARVSWARMVHVLLCQNERWKSNIVLMHWLHI